MAEIKVLQGTSSQSFSIGKGTSKGTITSGVAAINFDKAITINSTPVVTTTGTVALTNKTIDYSLNTITNLPGLGNGIAKTIKVNATTGATSDSTASIPSGSVVIDVRVNVKTQYNAGTIVVTVNGSSPVTIMAAADIFETEVGIYQSQPLIDIGATGTGKVRVAVAGAASGECDVYVTYIDSVIA